MLFFCLSVSWLKFLQRSWHRFDVDAIKPTHSCACLVSLERESVCSLLSTFISLCVVVPSHFCSLHVIPCLVAMELTWVVATIEPALSCAGLVNKESTNASEPTKFALTDYFFCLSVLSARPVALCHGAPLCNNQSNLRTGNLIVC